MTVSQKQREWNAAYQGTCMRIVIQPKLEIGEQIKVAAKAANQSVTKYILQAVFERMERENR